MEWVFAKASNKASEGGVQEGEGEVSTLTGERGKATRTRGKLD